MKILVIIAHSKYCYRVYYNFYCLFGDVKQRYEFLYCMQLTRYLTKMPAVFLFICKLLRCYSKATSSQFQIAWKDNEHQLELHINYLLNNVARKSRQKRSAANIAISLITRV